MKTLVIDRERCTGCHQCELACSFRKLGKFSPCDSRIRVETREDRCRSFPVVCLQCRDAPCASVCPADAIYRDPDFGAYKVDEARCLECGLCKRKCPLGAIVPDRRSGKALKCDLCDGDPACAAVCASRALGFTEMVHARARLRRQAAARIRASLTAERAHLPSGLTKLGGSD